MSAKRGAWILLRVVVSAACIYAALRQVRFQDTWLVRLAGGDTIAAAAVRQDEDPVAIVTLDGREVTRARSEIAAIEPREGFLALLARSDKALLACLVPLLLIPLALTALRWQMLLRAHGFRESFGRVFAVTYIGHFFSQFLPGTVGGDVARMALAVQGRDRKAAVAATVFLDRIIGLVAMVLMAAFAVIPFFRDTRLETPVYGVLALLGAMFVGYAVYFSRTLRASPIGRWIRERLPFGKTVREVDGVLKTLRHAPKTFLQGVLISVLLQLGSILIVYGMGRSLGLAVDVSAFLLFEPIIFIVTAVLPSMGGWGVQEVAYQKFFGMVGVSANAAVALSLLYKFSSVLISLPGGLLFAAGSHRRASDAAGAPSQAEKA